jgi:hypothetical protein
LERISARVAAKPSLVGAFTRIQSGLRWREGAGSGVMSFMKSQIAFTSTRNNEGLL